MAVVDFSNAVLEPRDARYPLTEYSTMKLETNAPLFNTSGSTITTNHSKRRLVDTLNKISILYTGQFITSGTECCPSDVVWKISNISFSAGDTYSFVIDVEIKGNV